MSIAEPAAALATDAALRRFAGYRLKRAFNVFRADLSEVLAPLGLRMLTFSALGVVVKTRGVRPSKLARALNIERPNLVSVIDELEEKGFIRRERDETDRRALIVSPTEAGATVFARASAAYDAREAAILAGVPAADVAAFLRVLDHLCDRNEGAAS